MLSGIYISYNIEVPSVSFRVGPTVHRACNLFLIATNGKVFVVSNVRCPIGENGSIVLFPCSDVDIGVCPGVVFRCG